MTEKQFKIYQIVTTILLAGVVSSSIVAGNYILPIIAVSIALAFIYTTKKMVKGIIEDERIVKIRQKSSRAAMTIFNIGAALISVVFMALSKTQSQFLVPGQTIAYLVCALMFLDVILYSYYEKKGD